MKTCPDCGERVYSLGCTNCNEGAYIEEQERLTDLYGSQTILHQHNPSSPDPEGRSRAHMPDDTLRESQSVPAREPEATPRCGAYSVLHGGRWCALKHNHGGDHYYSAFPQPPKSGVDGGERTITPEQSKPAMPDSSLSPLGASVRSEGEPSGAPYERNGIRAGERVGHLDYPKRTGTVLTCLSTGVRVRWDDGQLGDLVWDRSVAYDAFRLQTIRHAAPSGAPESRASEKPPHVRDCPNCRIEDGCWLPCAKHQPFPAESPSPVEPTRFSDADLRRRCDCGHDRGDHKLRAPEPCGSCGCDAFNALPTVEPITRERSDGEQAQPKHTCDFCGCHENLHAATAWRATADRFRRNCNELRERAEKAEAQLATVRAEPKEKQEEGQCDACGAWLIGPLSGTRDEEWRSLPSIQAAVVAHLVQVADAMGYPVEMAHSPGAVAGHVRMMAAALKETQIALEAVRAETLREANYRQVVEALLHERVDELDKAACDRCEQCGEMVMCSFHSVLSVLDGGTSIQDARGEWLKLPDYRAARLSTPEPRSDDSICPNCGHAPLSVSSGLRYCPQPPEGCGNFETRDGIPHLVTPPVL